MHAQDDAAAEVEFDPRAGLLPPVGGRPEREFHAPAFRRVTRRPRRQAMKVW
jgi:hypothetical protein